MEFQLVFIHENQQLKSNINEMFENVQFTCLYGVQDQPFLVPDLYARTSPMDFHGNISASQLTGWLTSTSGCFIYTLNNPSSWLLPFTLSLLLFFLETFADGENLLLPYHCYLKHPVLHCQYHGLIKIYQG